MTAAARKITNKIVGYSVEKPKPAEAEKEPAAPRAPEVVSMNENLKRPEMLVGATYKVKTPVSDHAMYVTINDIVLNPGTPHEQRRPFEMFINSKNLEHYQWIVALTRIISAVFRKGGDVTFLVEELKAVFDPRGGYWQRGGIFMPSIVAELGHVIEKHLRMIGLMADDRLDEEQRKLIEERREAFEALTKSQDSAPTEKGAFPPNAQFCGKCNTKALIVTDGGCRTCVNCGDSKCG